MNAALTTISSKQTLPFADFQAFMGALEPASYTDYELGQELSGVLMGANEDLYLPLHNKDNELTGVKVLRGESAPSVIGTGASESGYYLLDGQQANVILLTESAELATLLHRETDYSVALLGAFDDFGNVSKQVAPFQSNNVSLYCWRGESDAQELLVSHGIQGVDCTFEQDMTSVIGEAVKKAKLRIPKGFAIKEDGVYQQSQGKDGVLHETWLCSPLVVGALTRDLNSTRWGRYVELLDSDGITHQFAMPMEQLTNSSFIKALVHRGLVYEYGTEKHINRYLSQAKPIQRARSVSKTGWYDDVFVFPEKVIGETHEKVVYQSSTSLIYSYDERGTLKEWQENVSALCVGNSRLTFGVATAFATMLLKLVDGECGGFHFRSGSSRGKTTILTMAKSVFGSPESLPRWRATVDGLEGLAASHNHTLLCLDEFGQLAEVSPKSAGEAIYMLGNGEGKQRSKSNGAMMDRSSWQLLYLSAGEVSLKSVMEGAGLKVRGGQEVRFIDLPADAGANLGAFDTVQDFADGNQFALAIKEGSLKYYGTAATAFLELVSGDYKSCKQSMLSKMAEFIESLELAESDPQVHRVAQRFAQVAAAGEIATELGVTGWEARESFKAATVCFDAWIESRGGHGSQEEKQILEQVSNKLLSWGLLRLNTAEQAAARNGDVWGTQDTNHFFIYSKAFKNTLCEGVDSKMAETVLLKHGVLISQGNRNTVQKKINGTNVRVYKLDKRVLEFSNMESEDEPKQGVDSGIVSE
jgi:putative DNA primase/helicase